MIQAMVVTKIQLMLYSPQQPLDFASMPMEVMVGIAERMVIVIAISVSSSPDACISKKNRTGNTSILMTAAA